MTSKSFKERFFLLMNEVQVGKNVKNEFGNFKYRTKPQVLETIKPLAEKYLIIVNTTSELIELSGRVFVESTAIAEDVLSDEKRVAKAQAELQAKAGTKMSEPQLTGSSDSYAGKYALGNLFSIDDNVDPDSLDNNEKTIQRPTTTPQGNDNIKNASDIKAKILTTPNNTITKELANDLYKKANGNEEAIKMLIIKAKTQKLTFNEATKTFE